MATREEFVIVETPKPTEIPYLDQTSGEVRSIKLPLRERLERLKRRDEQHEREEWLRKQLAKQQQ